MDFILKIFSRSSKKNMASSNTEENTKITREQIDQGHSEVDNSNNLESERATKNNKDNMKSTESPVISVNESGITKTFHNLANVAPIEFNTDDYEKELNLNKDCLYDDLMNIAAELGSVTNDKQDDTNLYQSDNDLKQTHSYKAEISNDLSYITEADTNSVLDEESMQNLKEFEEVLNNVDKTALGLLDFEPDLINLDDIFNELDGENDSLISLKSLSVLENNDSATLTKITGLNKEELSIINENVDIISIHSSTDDGDSQTVELKDTITINGSSDESDTDDGYNSSDFEFISEIEAKMTGIIINFDVKKHRNLSQASSEPVIEYFDKDQDVDNEMPGPSNGPSRQKKPKNEFEDRSYRNDHEIPEGDNFLGLFQGIYNPLLPMSDIYFLENKSVRTSAMNSQYDGIGFDKQLALRRHQPDSSEDEFAEEARKSAKKILSMYPGQNRKRRRRYF